MKMRIENGRVITSSNGNHAPTSLHPDQLADIAGRFDAALADYERERGDLLHPDGVPRFGVRENKTMTDAAINKLKAAAERAKVDAAALRDAANNTLAALDIDPLLQVHSDAERAEVAYKLPLIKEATESDSIDDVTTQVKAATLHGSRVEQLLWLKYGEKVVERVKAEYVGALRGVVEPASFEEAEREIKRAVYADNQAARPSTLALTDALSELKSIALGDTLSKRKAAQVAASDAGKLIMRINLKLDNLLSPAKELVNVRKRF